MSALTDHLRATRTKETKLSTGRVVRYHLPDIEECLAYVGRVPMPALVTTGPKPTEAEALAAVLESPEAMSAGVAYQWRVVATMLEEVDGFPVTDDERNEVVSLLEPVERAELFMIGTREVDERGEADAAAG